MPKYAFYTKKYRICLTIEILDKFFCYINFLNSKRLNDYFSIVQYFVLPPLALITASSLRDMDSTRLCKVPNMIFWCHTCKILCVKLFLLLGLSLSSSLPTILQRFSIRFKSGLFPGHLRETMPLASFQADTWKSINLHNIWLFHLHSKHID